ncbi:MAG: CCA tRNA nucleotidyltransferase [Bacteroidales bacterium]|nr:CCA tRNA nucleotidyltransferase [Bacteroidales bacterium]
MRVEAYVVGGYVRDLLLGHPSKDIDVVVVGKGIELAQAVAQKAGNCKVKIFKNFGTAMMRYNDWEIEFVGARRESYRRDSRKPIVEEGTLEDDQNRRDFTINAMSISLNEASYGTLIDPFGGEDDLKNGVIRTPLDPDITYSDDPLRMMRAVRFASTFNFRINQSSYEALSRNAKRLSIISQERISDELNKIILSPKPSLGFKVLFNTGLLHQFFPEMVALQGAEFKEGKGHKDNFFHTLIVLDNVAEMSDNLWLRWAAILHDIGKPKTKKWVDGIGWTFHAHDFIGAKMLPGIFKRLKLPMGDNLKYVQKLVALHLRPIALTEEIVSDSAVRRLLFDAGDEIDDLMLLCSADMSSKIPEKIKRYKENFELVRQKLIEIEEKDKLRNWQPPISGELIMETFGLKPCKTVGDIKTTIREAILDGKIKNDYGEAYAFMIETGNNLGLSLK